MFEKIEIKTKIIWVSFYAFLEVKWCHWTLQSCAKINWNWWHYLFLLSGTEISRKRYTLCKTVGLREHFLIFFNTLPGFPVSRFVSVLLYSIGGARISNLSHERKGNIIFLQPWAMQHGYIVSKLCNLVVSYKQVLNLWWNYHFVCMSF